MEKTLILYPAISMMILTLFVYVKNYFNFVKAEKSNAIKFSYFKTLESKPAAILLTAYPLLAILQLCRLLIVLYSSRISL